MPAAWSRFTGQTASRVAVCDLPEMEPADARGLDGAQAVLSWKVPPQAAKEAARKQADALMKPSVEHTALNLPD